MKQPYQSSARKTTSLDDLPDARLAGAVWWLSHLRRNSIDACFRIVPQAIFDLAELGLITLEFHEDHRGFWLHVESAAWRQSVQRRELI